MTSKAIVIGGSGAIGTAICERPTAAGHEALGKRLRTACSASKPR